MIEEICAADGRAAVPPAGSRPAARRASVGGAAQSASDDPGGGGRSGGADTGAAAGVAVHSDGQAAGVKAGKAQQAVEALAVAMAGAGAGAGVVEGDGARVAEIGRRLDAMAESLSRKLERMAYALGIRNLSVVDNSGDDEAR